MLAERKRVAESSNNRENLWYSGNARCKRAINDGFYGIRENQIRLNFLNQMPQLQKRIDIVDRIDSCPLEMEMLKFCANFKKALSNFPIPAGSAGNDTMTLSDKCSY